MIGKIKLFMELTNQEDAFTKEIRKLIVDAKEEPVFEQSDETNESLKGTIYFGSVLNDFMFISFI